MNSLTHAGSWCSLTGMPEPIAEGLFTWPSESPALIGSSCRRCGATTFPAQASCPRCTAVDVEERQLATTGTLWSFTVQGFPPKPPYAGPDEFRPYGVGYVELPGPASAEGRLHHGAAGGGRAGVVVEARLTEDDPAALEIGMPMELVVVPFGKDGDDRVTFAFRPAGGEGSAA
jgi:uncharacterized OB-fold protein